MPPKTRGPVSVSLGGPSASRLARRLFDRRPAEGFEAVWEELARHTGRAARVAHDWDPQEGRLLLAAH